MRCPNCSYLDSKVVDSRPSDDGMTIRRRRECLSCGRRFTTDERLGESPLTVVKSDGSSEVYNRHKLFRGMLTACAKRRFHNFVLFQARIAAPRRDFIVYDQMRIEAVRLFRIERKRLYCRVRVVDIDIGSAFLRKFV